MKMVVKLKISMNLCQKREQHQRLKSKHQDMGGLFHREEMKEGKQGQDIQSQGLSMIVI